MDDSNDRPCSCHRSYLHPRLNSWLVCLESSQSPSGDHMDCFIKIFLKKVFIFFRNIVASLLHCKAQTFLKHLPKEQSLSAEGRLGVPGYYILSCSVNLTKI